MDHRRRRRLLVATLAATLAATLTACGGSDADAHPEHAPDAIVATSAPARATVRRAFLLTTTSGGGSSAGAFGGGREVTHIAPHYVYTLEIDGQRPMELESSPLAQRPDAEVADVTRVRLESAGDGHALAVSMNGGARWRTYILDVGAPLLIDTPPSGDPDDVGSSRDAIIAMLRAGAARPSVTLKRDPSVEPLARALAMSCAESADEELALAAAAVLVHQINPMHLEIESLRRDDAHCIVDQLAALPALGAFLREALRRPSDARNAAWILSTSRDPADQDALADALLAPVPAPTPERGAAFEAATRRGEAWALGAITSRRHDASTHTVAVLTTLAQGPTDRLPLDGGAIRANALRALAALPDNETAHAVLVALAAGDCTRAMGPISPTFTDPDELHGDASSFEPACWARALLGPPAE